jgi:hypothetical protein
MTGSRFSRALCALLMLGALVAFSGCGGSGGGSVADYQAGAKKAGEKFNSAAQAASAKIKSGQTLEGKLGGLSSLKLAVNQAADGYSALDPPANLKAENGQLVTEFHNFAAVIDEAIAAIKSRDRARLAVALSKLPSIQSQIGQILGKIQAKLGG